MDNNMKIGRRIMRPCYILFILLSIPAFAQDTTFRYELSGMVSYSYIDFEGHFNSDGLERPSHDHIISFQPSVGYFLSTAFEIIVQPEYDFSYEEANQPKYDYEFSPPKLIGRETFI